MRPVSLGSQELAQLAREVLGRGGTVTFTAHGRSMRPTFRDGDVLTIRPADSVALEPGDVVLHLDAGGGAAVHRLVGVCDADDGRLRLSCDARPEEIYEILSEWVLGKAVSARRGGRELRLGPARAHRTRPAGLRLRTALVEAASWPARHLARCRPARRMCSMFLGALASCRMSGSFGEPSHRLSWERVSLRLLGVDAGYAQLVRFGPGSPFSGRQWLFGVRVRKPFRGFGLGRRLVDRAVKLAEGGEGELCLLVEPENSPAVSLYRSAGFRPVDPSAVAPQLAERIGQGRILMCRRTCSR
mgnify:CR=1 FL=1